MSDPAAGATAFFTELVEAVRFSQDWSESVEKQAEARRELERQLDAIDELQTKISALFETKKLDQDIAGTMAKSVNDFVSAAVQQAKAKLNERMKRSIEEVSAETNSLKLKAVKSLESFLAITPLPVLDEEIGLDLSEGSYASYASYKCSGQIEYEFLLNTANSALFKSHLAVSATWKGTRLPVRLSKAWLKKEPVPDYERLDNYVLLNARASRNHLSVTFSNRETLASVAVVFSRSNNDSFVTVEYTDKAGRIDITGEPSLNRHLDLIALKRMMASLLDAIEGLDHEKLRLVRLESSGEDILASLKCFDLMKAVVGAFVQSNATMQAIRQLDPRLTTDRLKLLGGQGDAVYVALGLGVQRASPRS